MSFIAFLGCDGSGKSTVIQGVIQRMKTDGFVVTSGHWQPRPFAKPAEKSQSAADDPHGLSPRGSIASLLKLGWLWLNWWLAWFQSLRAARRNGVVLFDRYHIDLLVDPRRYRYGGPVWLAALMSRWMPQPDLVVFLDAEPEVLLTRKQEVSAESLATSRKSYLRLASNQARWIVVDASRPLDEVIELVYVAIQQLSSRQGFE